MGQTFEAAGSEDNGSYVLVTEYDDVLKCTLSGDTATTPEDYWIAKPYILRKKAYDGEVIDGVTYTYVNKNTRDAENSTREWTENIIQEYLAGDIITAGVASPNASTDSDDELWVDDAGETQSGPGSTPPAAPVNNLVSLVEISGGARVWVELAELDPDETLLPAHSSDEAANTVTWDVDAPNIPATDRGVMIQVMTDQIISTTDSKIYNYYRVLNFDSTGRLSEVESETREESLPVEERHVVQSTTAANTVTYNTTSGVLANAVEKSLVFPIESASTNTIDTAEDC